MHDAANRSSLPSFQSQGPFPLGRLLRWNRHLGAVSYAPHCHLHARRAVLRSATSTMWSCVYVQAHRATPGHQGSLLGCYVFNLTKFVHSMRMTLGVLQMSAWRKKLQSTRGYQCIKCDECAPVWNHKLFV